jgi:DNA (cytosine-5)-methyltransferase 1
LTLTFGSLFAGIEGIGLGLERAGLKCVWQVENDEYCKKVLERHWPGVPRYGDIRETKDLPYADLICGGFPCQDISTAGKRVGIKGKRSGLWFEFARIIGETRPKYVLIENVPPLIHLGLGQVMRDLRVQGYQPLRPILIEAASVGAPHKRERIFIIAVREDLAHPKGIGGGEEPNQERIISPSQMAHTSNGYDSRLLHNPGRGGEAECGKDKGAFSGDGGIGKDIPNTEKSGQLRKEKLENNQKGERARRGLHADIKNIVSGDAWRQDPADKDPSSESFVGRVADGVPDRVDRLKCLGNAVVPQVAEFLGWMITRLDDILK